MLSECRSAVTGRNSNKGQWPLLLPWIRRQMKEILEEADLMGGRADRTGAQESEKFSGFVELAFVLRYMLAFSN